MGFIPSKLNNDHRVYIKLRICPFSPLSCSVNPFVSGVFLIHILQGVVFFDENEMLPNKSPIIDMILEWATLVWTPALGVYL